ncbi:hypothetical protein ACOME3_004151 [Neoechinorhynchus agilis]
MSNCPMRSIPDSSCSCEVCQVLMGSLASIISFPLLCDHLTSHCIHTFVLMNHEMFGLALKAEDFSWSLISSLLLGCRWLPHQSLRRGPVQTLCLLYRDIIHASVYALKSSNPTAPHACAATLLGTMCSLCLVLNKFSILDRDTLTVVDISNEQFEPFVLKHLYIALDNASFDYAWEILFSSLGLMVVSRFTSEHSLDFVSKTIDLFVHHVENSPVNAAIHACHLLSLLSEYHTRISDQLIRKIIEGISSAILRKVPSKEMSTLTTREKEYFHCLANCVQRWILKLDSDRMEKMKTSFADSTNSPLMTVLNNIYEAMKKLNTVIMISYSQADKNDLNEQKSMVSQNDISSIRDLLDYVICNLMCKFGVPDNPYQLTSSFLDIDECNETHGKFFFLGPECLMSITDRESTSNTWSESTVVIRQRCGKFVWTVRRKLPQISDDFEKSEDAFEEVGELIRLFADQAERRRDAMRPQDPPKSERDLYLEPPWSSTAPPGFDFLSELERYILLKHTEVKMSEFLLDNDEDAAVFSAAMEVVKIRNILCDDNLSKDSKESEDEDEEDDVCSDDDMIKPSDKGGSNLLYLVNQLGWLKLYCSQSSSVPIPVSCDEQLLRELKHFDSNLGCSQKRMTSIKGFLSYRHFNVDIYPACV